MAEEFEETFSEFYDKSSVEGKYLITQNCTPGIQVIFVCCVGYNDICLLESFLLELQKKSEMLSSWSQFFVSKRKKKVSSMTLTLFINSLVGIKLR